MPTLGPGSVASAEVVSYEAIRAAWLQLRMPYAPGASETVSVVPHSCLWRNSGSSALLGHVPPWGVPSYSPSLSPHQENRFSAQGRAFSFPSWTEAPTSWSGVRAPSMTFVKARGDRESPRERTLYYHARPSNANHRNGLCHRRIETWM